MMVPVVRSKGWAFAPSMVLLGFTVLLLPLFFLVSIDEVDGDVVVPEFDFYVFAMSFQPEFCYEHRGDDYDGCTHPRKMWKSQLTIHGMWPENVDGTWPSSCTDEPLDINGTILPILPELEQYWPNVKSSTKGKHHSQFWSHEWTKHGTCSGLTQKSYFQETLKHFVSTPDMVGQHYGKTLKKAELINAYDGNVALVCQHKRYLSEVRVCLNMVSGVPTSRMPCPAVVLKEDNCGDEISITKFSGVVK
mmetsp:Transcript_39136/g.55088  ORF Transcript_39136/g.55088 Transcript_39136/m.55088 type:complete len:248 (-) Transcript_39136:35-778(-)